MSPQIGDPADRATDARADGGFQATTRRAGYGGRALYRILRRLALTDGTITGAELRPMRRKLFDYLRWLRTRRDYWRTRALAAERALAHRPPTTPHA